MSSIDLTGMEKNTPSEMCLSRSPVSCFILWYENIPGYFEILIWGICDTSAGPLKLICCTCLTLLHSERPKLYTILAFLSEIGLSKKEQH